MSRNPSPLSPKAKLNKIAPGAAEIGLGQIAEDVITAINLHTTAINAMRTDWAALIAKLNADAGVTDTNYATTAVAAQAAITALSAR